MRDHPLKQCVFGTLSTGFVPTAQQLQIFLQSKIPRIEEILRYPNQKESGRTGLYLCSYKNSSVDFETLCQR